MIGIISKVDFEIIEALVKAKPVLVQIRNNEEVPPLHEAVKNRRLDIVKLLLEYGASVNDYDLDLENALHIAAPNSDYDMIEFLLNETEVDPRARNRDDMNPLCLLLVRSNNEDVNLAERCFYLLLENTYDKNPMTNAYEISDIFQCAFLACVYSHMEIAKFLIHNVYSISNSKYALIQRLSEHCNGDDAEFLYYSLVFLHDKIEAYDQYCFPRFSEINYFMCIRSVSYVIETLLSSDDAVELIITVLEEMRSIGFMIRINEFFEQIGAILFKKFTSKAIAQVEMTKIDQILRYLQQKGFRMNAIARSFLHSIVIARDSEAINVESSKTVLTIILHYATTFLVDLECWRQVNGFKQLNPQIKEIVHWLVTNFGNRQLNDILDVNLVYPLKHLCRNKVREELKYDVNVLCNRENLASLGLPEILLDYLVFKE